MVKRRGVCTGFVALCLSAFLLTNFASAEVVDAPSVSQIKAEREAFIAINEYLINTYGPDISVEVILTVCGRPEDGKKIGVLSKYDEATEYERFVTSKYYKKEFSDIDIGRVASLMFLAKESLRSYQMGYWMSLRKNQRVLRNDPCKDILSEIKPMLPYYLKD